MYGKSDPKKRGRCRATKLISTKGIVSDKDRQHLYRCTNKEGHRGKHSNGVVRW